MTPRVVFTLQRGVTGRSDGSVERTSPPLTAIAAMVRPKASRHGAGPIGLAVHHRYYAFRGISVSPASCLLA